MSYQTTDGVMDWLFGSPVGAPSAAETAAAAVQKQVDAVTTPRQWSTPAADFTKSWTGIKVSLIQKHGVYRDAQGVPLQSKGGVPLPKVTYAQLNAIYGAWISIGDKLWNELGGGRSDLKYKWNRARFDLIQGWSGWYLKWSGLPSYLQQWEGKYVQYQDVDEVFRLISKYVIELTNIDWSRTNIESAYERAINSLPPVAKQIFQAGWYTAKGVDKAAPAVKDLFKKTWEATKSVAGVTYYALKYGPYAVVLGGALYFYLKARGPRR